MNLASEITEILHELLLKKANAENTTTNFSEVEKDLELIKSTILCGYEMLERQFKAKELRELQISVVPIENTIKLYLMKITMIFNVSFSSDSKLLYDHLIENGFHVDLDDSLCIFISPSLNNQMISPPYSF